jgi:hypothetical protein
MPRLRLLWGTASYRSVPAGLAGRFDRGERQLQAGVDQFDIGYRDGQITAKDDSLVEKAIQQFEHGVVLGLREVRIVFHGNSLHRNDPAVWQEERQPLGVSRLAVRLQGPLDTFKLFQEPGFLEVEFFFVDSA